MKKTTIRLLCLLSALIMLFPLAVSFVGCGEEMPGGTDTVNTSATENETNSAETEETSAPVSDILLADLSEYALIRPEKPSEDLLDQIGVLHRKLKDDFGIGSYKDDFYREGMPMYQIGEYEIIVGNANRPESREFLSGLRYNDYGFMQIGTKIVIAGHTDETTIKAIEEFIFAVLLKKDGKEGVFYSNEYDYVKRLEYKIPSIHIGDVPVEQYRIVYPKRNGMSEKAAANMIAKSIAEVSGIVLSVIHDGEAEPNGCEILIGSTNRNTEAEISAISAKLGDSESVISYDGKNINVIGKSATSILVASNELLAKFKSEPTEKLVVSLEKEQICKFNDTLLKAMSFNVWVSGKTAERNERVLTMVMNYFPDTVGFQEVDPTWLSTLKSGLKDHYDFVGEGRNGGNSGEYNPIFYKKELFNLIDSGTKWLSDTPDTVSKVDESSLNRIYTYALLERKSDGTKIMVVNTHFDHTSAEAREKQAEILVKFLKTVTEYPIVLTGDFNCASSSNAYSKIISSGVVNSYDVADKKINNAATFTNYGTSNKIIDFVFTSPTGFAVASYKVCNETINGDFPSDHHPVLIEYTLLG